MSLVKERVRSIDILRGIVMVVMALDHTRDYFTNFHHNPTDLQFASTAMFFTRWITHFCAPVFIFLSGVSAFLSGAKFKSTREIAWFLCTRGFWLILLEVSIVRFGWVFNIDYDMVFLQVIWAIGWSMLFLALLVFLPRQLILLIGLLLVFGHNAFDNVHAESMGEYGMWWRFLHEPGAVELGGRRIFILYPLVPWVGVMATGYSIGFLFNKPAVERNRWLYGIGISSIVLFIVLRSGNFYGDAMHWEPQAAWWRSVLSFINCQKYPPSLLYLLMTIGTAITFMPLLERLKGAAASFFTVYGRVPMFYYILHIYLIHGMAMLVAFIIAVPTEAFTSSRDIFSPKANWGFSLPYVYLDWIIAILILYLPCRWYMNIKLSHKKWWLSYL